MEQSVNGMERLTAPQNYGYVRLAALCSIPREQNNDCNEINPPILERLTDLSMKSWI